VKQVLVTISLAEIIQEDNRRAPDLQEAFRLYQDGARLGHAGCCYHLGECYFAGAGIAENLTKGFKWYKVAAEKGDVQGTNRCSDCYVLGIGVEKSYELAIYWLE
jgi:uncharacterized protein